MRFSFLLQDLFEVTLSHLIILPLWVSSHRTAVERVQELQTAVIQKERELSSATSETTKIHADHGSLGEELEHAKTQLLECQQQLSQANTEL